ncbi:MAG: heparinase II/III-family protein, partial [Chloroflexi bacterium]|nr:heparinase II/III-family protein [Chloroflexota bacterium]
MRRDRSRLPTVGLCLILVAMMLPGRVPASTRSPTVAVYPGHPRLIVGGYRGLSVAGMPARCADPAFQGQCANIGGYGHVNDLAMDYLLHSDTSAAASVVNHLLNDSFNCSYERSNVGGYAMAYDWVYNTISNQGTRDTIEGRLADCAVTISNTLGTNGPHLWHGYTSDAAALALVALSLDHDPRRADLLAAAERLFRSNALEAYAYVDGAWPEGISYLRSHFFSADPPSQFVLDAIRAWHSAVQQDDPTHADIYDTIRYQEGDWLQRLGLFHVYHLLPPYSAQSAPAYTWARHGDIPSGQLAPNKQYRPYTDAIADAYDDGVLQQLGAIIEDDWGFASGTGSYHSIHRYALPTNLDPFLPAAAFDTLPTAALFGRDTIGYAALRAGWSDDAAVILYRAGDWFTGHQHLDQGHFEIWRSGPLAVDSGVYADWGTEHRESYYIRTVAHNSLLVRQPGETFAYGYSAGNTNDGGQRVQTYTGCAQCIQSVNEYESNIGAGKHYEAGDITAFIHAGDYDYVASDLTPAYNSTAYTTGSNTPKVALVQRELAYLRPNVLLVFDRVRATDAAYEKAWLLHAPAKPQTAAETVVQGTASNGIITSSDDVFRVDSGSGGRLFAQTLLPASHTIRKIGGTDYRYWSDGANRAGGAAAYETGYAEPGLWRVEVVPSTPQADDRFLHVLYITDTAASAMPATNLLTTAGGEMTGAHVAEPGHERVALFSTAMDGALVAGRVEYDVTAGGTCGHLLTGVLSDTVYQVTIGADVQTVISSAEHTLYFTTTQTGPLHISVAPLGTPPAAVTDLRVTQAVTGAGTLTATL